MGSQVSCCVICLSSLLLNCCRFKTVASFVKYYLHSSSSPGYYSPSNHSQISSPLCLNSDSFLNLSSIGGYKLKAPGTIINYNTVESFKTSDKVNLLNECTKQVTSLSTMLNFTIRTLALPLLIGLVFNLIRFGKIFTLEELRRIHRF